MMHEWPTENWPFSTCRRKTPLPEQQQGSSTGFLLHGSTRKWTFVCCLFCQWKCSATTNLDWLRSRLFLWYFGRDECCSGDTFLWVLCSPKANSLRLFSVYQTKQLSPPFRFQRTELLKWSLAMVCLVPLFPVVCNFWCNSCPFGNRKGSKLLPYRLVSCCCETIRWGIQFGWPDLWGLISHFSEQLSFFLPLPF